ncbi:MAG: DUF3500 domain-containing protein [Acidimicrobiia bacterium]|nr:DUF3500 domain-containing protein [Acidimicrobiia bacterium]
MSDWKSFGLRSMPPLSARTPVRALPPMLDALAASCRSLAGEALRGISIDGQPRRGLFRLDGAGASTAPIFEAAQRFVDQLDPAQRARLVFPLDADERRYWFNIHPNVFRHGLLLEDLSPAQRQAGLGILETTLSGRGFRQARDIMRLNGLLGELTGSADEYGEWPYWISLFGEPSLDAPWAWQIDGHHLNLNCTVLDDQVVMAPSFMGSEPCQVTDGPLRGTQVFGEEERAGLDLVRALDDTQLAAAVLRDSIHPDDLPSELKHPVDGRMVAGAFKDNAVVGHEGLRGDAMTDGQRRLLRSIVATYVGWADDSHTGVRMREVDAHLDETHFAWMGARRDEGPFYYRVHSPVVLIEFDHHPGVAFDNLVPSRHHVHSILRAPNGGDYGVDLLAQHYERFDHGGQRRRASAPPGPERRTVLGEAGQ